MKSSAKNIVLKSVDDIFQTEENRADAQRERVQEIPLDQLKPFRNHPFKVRDDQRMLDTVDSIREYGVLVPAIARPDPEGGYELISGHRRKRGCEMAGLQTMPVIIRDLDDDAAVLVMVDSNIQREELLPSERAFAYTRRMCCDGHGDSDGILCGSLCERQKRKEVPAQCRVRFGALGNGEGHRALPTIRLVVGVNFAGIILLNITTTGIGRWLLPER